MLTVDKAAQLSVDAADRATNAGSVMRSILQSMADTAGHLGSIAAGAAEQSERSAGANGALDEIRGAARRHFQEYGSNRHKESFVVNDRQKISHGSSCLGN